MSFLRVDERSEDSYIGLDILFRKSINFCSRSFFFLQFDLWFRFKFSSFSVSSVEKGRQIWQSNSKNSVNHSFLEIQRAFRAYFFNSIADFCRKPHIALYYSTSGKGFFSLLCVLKMRGLNNIF